MSSKFFVVNRAVVQAGDVKVIKEVDYNSSLHLDISTKITDAGINLEIYENSGIYYKVVIVKKDYNL